ncbi:MAG: adenine phosphoribosyltransferase [Hyphomonadaceae bacterium]|nr:adenine phosphoribosyltransferase [Hyphomonadaceae bacterium]
MNLKDTIRTIPDFPKPGIMFRDITTLMANHKAFREAVMRLAAPYRDKHINSVTGIDARGFVFSGAVALELGTGHVPVRKKGKLPFDTYEQDYELEYGTGTLEIHADAVRAHEKVLLIDDLIATGGTAEAAIHLLRRTGSEVVGAAFVIDLPDLGGLDKIIRSGVPATALVAFEGH